MVFSWRSSRIAWVPGCWQLPDQASTRCSSNPHDHHPSTHFWYPVALPQLLSPAPKLTAIVFCPKAPPSTLELHCTLPSSVSQPGGPGCSRNHMARRSFRVWLGLKFLQSTGALQIFAADSRKGTRLFRESSALCLEAVDVTCWRT